MTDVPLAEDFTFTGPVAASTSPRSGRWRARPGRAVTSFSVRRQFADGDTVCSIIDWEMAIPGRGTHDLGRAAAGLGDGIVRGELIDDAVAAACPGG